MVASRISEAKKGKPRSEANVAADGQRSATEKGRKHSPEHEANRVAALKGRKFSEEGKKAVSASCSTPEEIQRRKLATTGKVHSEATKAKIGAAAKGRTFKHTEEAKSKIGEALAKRIATHKGPWRETSLEKKLRSYLLSKGIGDLTPADENQPQVRFGRYVVDFYSPSRLTAYEADGAHWHRDVIKDARRDDAILAGYGVTVVRFDERTIKEGMEV